MIPTLSTLFIPKSVKEYGSGKLDGKLGLELLKTLLLLGLSGSSAGPRILRPDWNPGNRWNHSVFGVLLWFLPIVGSLQVPSVSTPLAPTCRACHISEPTIPKTPSSLRLPCVRHRSPTAPHVSRQWADSNPLMFSAQFFRFGSQQSQPPYRKRIAANTGRPSAKVPPDPLR